jgi:hypothetical protein
MMPPVRQDHVLADRKVEAGPLAYRLGEGRSKMRLLVFSSVSDPVSERQNRNQGTVQLVRDTAGQAPHGIHPVGVTHPHFQLAPQPPFDLQLQRGHGVVLEDPHGPAHLANLIATHAIGDLGWEIAGGKPFLLHLETAQRRADLLGSS